MQLKNVHNLSLIQNNIKITSTTRFRPYLAIENRRTRAIGPTSENIHMMGHK
jgi:hypothetical protein